MLEGISVGAGVAVRLAFGILVFGPVIATNASIRMAQRKDAQSFI